MRPVSRRTRQLVIASAVIVLLLIMVPRGGSAQTPATIRLGAVAHTADGTTVLPLTASAADLAALAVTIDGEPVPFEVSTDTADAPTRVVFVVENSVSMTAFQLADLQARMLEIAAGLGGGDQLGIVTYGGPAAVALPLTADRAAFEAAVNGIAIDGSSALYSGVATAGDMLAPGGGPGLIVLVTYGWDWGGVSTHTREESVAAVTATGASVYVQSMIYDPGVDLAYLSSLASDGVVHDVTQLPALPVNAPALVGGAAPQHTLTISAPPLAQGQHELAVTGDNGIAQTAAFDVTNEGLLTIGVGSSSEDTAPISVSVSSAAGFAGLELTASLDGTLLEVAADGSIEVDPWAFNGGTSSLEIVALVDGVIAASTATTMTIPTLAPVVTVDQSDADLLVATLEAQPGTVTSFVAVQDGAVIAEATDGRIEIARPASGTVTFEARDAADAAVAIQEVSATAVVEVPVESSEVSGSSGSSILTSPAMLAVPLVLIVLAVLLRRRSAARSEHTSASHQDAAVEAVSEYESQDEYRYESPIDFRYASQGESHDRALSPAPEAELPSGELVEEPEVFEEPQEFEEFELAEVFPSGDSTQPVESARTFEPAPEFEPVEDFDSPEDAESTTESELAQELEAPAPEVEPIAIAPKREERAARTGRSMFGRRERSKPTTPQPAPAAEWTVVVRTPNGQTQRIELGREPVSIGASKLCTVTLIGDAVRFVHLVVAREGREVKAHQFGPVTVGGVETNVEDAPTLMASVMQIGDVVIWLEQAVEGENLDELTGSDAA